MAGKVFKFILVCQFIGVVTAGCNGRVNLPVEINAPNTHTYVGKKTYIAPDVHSLANQLMLDIPALTLAYANVLAEDAFYIEENNEITYRFFIKRGTAQLNQFKVVSTTLGNKQVNIEWNIVRARLTFKAYVNVKIQRNRRRRRWIGGGRRRCTWKKLPRGVNKNEIAKIQDTLTSTMNRVSSRSKVFVLKRVINMKSKSKGTCAAWKRVVNIPLTRGCSKRAGKTPRAFTKPVDPRVGRPNKRLEAKRRIPVRKFIRRKGGMEPMMLKEY